MEFTKYSVTQGESDYDWNKILDQHRYTNEEILMMCNLAGHWISCAVGTQCSIIPRDMFGGPNDGPLNDLGIEFDESIRSMYRAHNDQDWNEFEACQEDAKRILSQIEERSQFLINQIKGNV